METNYKSLTTPMERQGQYTSVSAWHASIAVSVKCAAMETILALLVSLRLPLAFTQERQGAGIFTIRMRHFQMSRPESLLMPTVKTRYYSIHHGHNRMATR